MTYSSRQYTVLLTTQEESATRFHYSLARITMYYWKCVPFTLDGHILTDRWLKAHINLRLCRFSREIWSGNGRRICEISIGSYIYLLDDGVIPAGYGSWESIFSPRDALHGFCNIIRISMLQFFGWHQTLIGVLKTEADTDTKLRFFYDSKTCLHRRIVSPLRNSAAFIVRRCIHILNKSTTCDQLVRVTADDLELRSLTYLRKTTDMVTSA